MSDDLTLRRQCLAAFRALVARCPSLRTKAAHQRLDAYLHQHTASGGDVRMPAKDYRTLGEDLINVAVRLPQSVIDQVDAHIETLRGANRWAKVARSDALRDLVLRGLDSVTVAAAAPHQATPVPQVPRRRRRQATPAD